RHVADGHAYLIDTFVGMANGQPGPDMNKAALNAYNAQTGEQHAAADKDETIQILKQHGASAAERVRGLSDDQLTRSGKLLSDGPSMPVEQWIEHVLIGHPRSHLASIRAALGQTA
ncbi:MAG TPA: hypothetical protein VFU81_20675, partial [Thermomicrobiales bacterium]|nr:hypothetical protein [Thermomicrobiales bacterium]